MKDWIRLLDHASRTLAGATGSVLTGACIIPDIEVIVAKYEVTEALASSGEGSTTQDTSIGTSTGTTADSTGSLDTSTSGVDGSTSPGSSSSDTSSTGPAAPLCGDGLVEGDETCDDGNDIPGDGCQSCAADSIVFITSEAYQGFKLGGLYGADQRCRNLAAKAGLAHPLTFMAWLSTSTMSVADRMLPRKAATCWSMASSSPRAGMRSPRAPSRTRSP